MINHEHYTYRVIWSEEDGEFVGLCDEFPGISWLEENQADAFRGIVDAVGEIIEDMAANNEPIPEPLNVGFTAG